MKKALISFIILLFPCFILSAQNDNYVILLDCTRSMNHPSGIYTPVHNDTAREDEPLWNNAKSTVKSLFEHAVDGDVLNIVLFQEDIHNVITGIKEGNELRTKGALLDWNSIEQKYIEKAIERTQNTCILTAWKKGEELIDTNITTKGGMNKFFLITDGNEDHGFKSDPLGTKAKNHTKDLCKRISEFCHIHSNTVGYYSNIDILQEFYSANNIIYDALRMSSCFHIVYGGGFKTKSITLTQEDLNRGYRDFVLEFSTLQSEGTNTQPRQITIENVLVQSVSSNYFRGEILGNKIDSNRATLRVYYDSSLGMPELNADNTYSFDIIIASTGKERIFDQHIKVTAYYKLPKLAYLPTDIPDRFVSFYRKPFPVKWVADRLPRIAGEVDSSFVVIPFKEFLPEGKKEFFGREAIRHYPTMSLSLDSKSKKQSLTYTLFANDSKVSGNLVIRNNDDYVVKLDFEPENEKKKYKDKLYLSIVENQTFGVDQINEQDYASYEAIIPIEYSIIDSPLTIWLRLLMWILVILVICCVIFSQLFKSTIRGTLKISINGKAISPITFSYKPLNLGYKRCVLTPSNIKQSGLNGLLTGYDKIISAPDADTTIIMTPSKRGILYIYDKHSKNYLYQLTHAQTAIIQNIEITYNAHKY